MVRQELLHATSKLTVVKCKTVFGVADSATLETTMLLENHHGATPTIVRSSRHFFIEISGLIRKLSKANINIVEFAEKRCQELLFERLRKYRHGPRDRRLKFKP